MLNSIYVYIIFISVHFYFKVKAAVRVINPKEVNYLVTGEKLDRHLFARNLSRAKIVYTWIVNAFTIMK